MSAVAGILSIQNADRTNDLVGEFQETILVRNAKGYNVGTTLFGLMSRLKVEQAENNEFNWFERDPVRRELSVATADGTAPSAQDEADTVVLEETTAGGNAYPYLCEGHILRNERTGEYMSVTATPTTNTVSVLRAINTSDAGTLATYTLVADDTIVIVSLAKTEGADPTQARFESADLLTNYVQTFNSTVELTNAFKGNKLRTDTEGPLRERRLQALESVSKDIELGFLLGVKRRITSSSKFKYLTGGVVDAVNSGAPSNALDGQGDAGVDFETLSTWMQQFMTQGSEGKLAFCGPKSYAAVSNYAIKSENGFRITQQENVFGMNITAIQTPFGELDLTMHPLFKEITAYNSLMVVVDLAHIVQKSMEPLFLESNIQTPGQDSYKEQYRAKLGIKLKFAEAFAYAKDFRKIL